ncbi:MAG: HAMP domain-containing histidine kinase [bacterium]|nr:HAMP domain-containing histidine kinase [bacterium]
MRLAVKVFFAASVAVLLLGGVATWCLTVVNRLVIANQAIATRTVPAMRLESRLEEGVQSLIRAQRRAAVLDDPGYTTLRDRRLADVEAEIDRLGPFLLTERERRLLRKSDRGVARFREALAAQASAEVGPPPARADPAVDAAAAWAVLRPLLAVERTLHELSVATFAAADRWRRRTARLESRTWTTIAVALPASLLVALLSAAILALRMGAALRRIARASDEVAAGTFTGRLGVRSRDEIGDLARAFEQMATRLGDLDRLKQELFAHISHELRTPLTAVREAVQLLRERVPGPLTPRQERLVDIVGAATERMLRLVNRILDLSRLRAGLAPFDRRAVDVGRLVERAAGELQPQADAAGVRVLARSDADLVLYGDPERLLEVVTNLLANAVKATSEGGLVEVLARVAGQGSVEIAVRDTGVGIDAEALPRIFDPYVQAPGAQGGTGLGLAIAKSVVEAHGGAITAASAPGAGSCFTVRLPRDGRPA